MVFRGGTPVGRRLHRMTWKRDPSCLVSPSSIAEAYWCRKGQFPLAGEKLRYRDRDRSAMRLAYQLAFAGAVKTRSLASRPR